MGGSEAFDFVEEIPNPGGATWLPSVRFSPCGGRFIVVFRDHNAVRIYDSATLACLREIAGPETGLDFPHGLAATARHIVISNRHEGPPRPSRLAVYAAEGEDNGPLHVFETPFPHLELAHSLAIRDDVLVATYCEGPAALITYRFDPETGAIGAPVSVIERWFAVNGAPKGVTVSEDGRHVLITYVTDPPRAGVLPNLERWVKGRIGAVEFLRAAELDRRWPFRGRLPEPSAEEAVTNGIAAFALDREGRLSETPEAVLPMGRLARLENIQTAAGHQIVTDPRGQCVSLYRAESLPTAAPAQVIREHLSFPHDAALSPDGRMLLATNYGVRISRGRIRFGERIAGKDTISVFRAA
ncbi:MAG: hypothetical protein AAFW69_06040 [Pseudomonadota bacterium]